jgi:hypothetical protein
MDYALRAGYGFDFSADYEQVKTGLEVTKDCSGIYIANLCFTENVRMPGLSITTKAKEMRIPVLVRTHNDGDKEICERRSLEIAHHIPFKIIGNSYLMQRFRNVFGKKQEREK